VGGTSFRVHHGWEGRVRLSWVRFSWGDYLEHLLITEEDPELKDILEDVLSFGV